MTPTLAPRVGYSCSPLPSPFFVLFPPFWSLVPPFLCPLPLFWYVIACRGRVVPWRPHTWYSCPAARRHVPVGWTFGTLGRETGPREWPAGRVFGNLARPGPPASAPGRVVPWRPHSWYSCSRAAASVTHRHHILVLLPSGAAASVPPNQVLLVLLPSRGGECHPQAPTLGILDRRRGRVVPWRPHSWYSCSRPAASVTHRHH